MPPLPQIWAQTSPAQLQLPRIPAGATGEELFGQFAESAHALAKVNDAVEYSKIKTLLEGHNEEAKQLVENMKVKPDDWNQLLPAQAIQRFHDQANQSDKDLLTQIPPRYRPHAEILLANQRKANFNQFFNVWAGLSHDWQKGQYQIRQAQGLQDAAEHADDPMLLNSIRNTLTADTKAMAHAGVLKQEEMAHDLINIPSKIAEMPALQIINGNQPDRFFSNMNQWKDLTGDQRIRLADLATKRVDTVIRQDYEKAQRDQKQLDDTYYKQALEGNVTVDFLQKNATMFSPGGYNRIAGVLEKNPIAQAPGMANDIRQKWIDDKMTNRATTEGIERLRKLTERFPHDTDAHRYLKELQDHYRSLAAEGRAGQSAEHMARVRAAENAMRDVDSMQHQGRRLEDWYLGGIQIQMPGQLTRKQKWGEALKGMTEDIKLGRKTPDQAKKDFQNTITGGGTHREPDSQPGSADETGNRILREQGLQ